MKKSYTRYMFSFKKVLLSALLLSLVPTVAFASSLSLDPAKGTYGPGDTFIETVRINTDTECINAANIELAYPTDSLRAVDFSRGDSIFSLWAVEPTINTEKGTVVFAGGIPGGYCGRIAGDAGLTNVVGKVVFTVVSKNSDSARIHFASTSAVYLNDGLGTADTLSLFDSVVQITSEAQLGKNEWLDSVKQDTTAPQPFTVDVESTSGVFNGRYYIVFSTIDKESGLDHFEIHEGGGWKHILSPYELKNQSLLGVGDIEVRAVDKAGNIRLGLYTPSLVPKRQLPFSVFIPFIIFGVIILIGALSWWYEHRKNRIRPVQ